MKKVMLIIFMVLTLCFTMITHTDTVTALDNGDSLAPCTDKAIVKTKDEVVYAKLDTDGRVKGIYLVNSFDITHAGLVTDFGSYDVVTNLTNSSVLTYKNGSVSFAAPAGRFDYQGNIDAGSTKLPWRFNITHYLDGTKVSADDLGGRSGGLRTVIEISGEGDGGAAFRDNYLLQITLTLDTKLCKNISADGASVANAGSDKQVVFTVLPGREGHLVCEADVTDFEMPGIDIAAVPYSVDIDTLGISGMTDRFSRLTDGIAQLHDGVGRLNDGTKKMDGGMKGLVDGASRLRSGVGGLTDGVSRLDSGIGELTEGIKGLSNGLDQVADLNSTMIEGSSSMKSGLESISHGIRSGISGWDAIESMLSTHGIRLGYKEVAVMDQDDDILQSIAASSDELTASKIIACAQMKLISQNPVNSQLLGGIEQITNNYSEYDAGMASYTEGISTIAAQAHLLYEGSGAVKDGSASLDRGIKTVADGVTDLANGMQELSDGMDGLRAGVSRLHDGTGELKDQTSNLSGQVQSEIDDYISQYDYSDFKPVSFADPRNKEIELVQFVFSTEPVNAPDTESEAPVENAQPGFWDKLWALFKFWD